MAKIHLTIAAVMVAMILTAHAEQPPPIISIGAFRDNVVSGPCTMTLVATNLTSKRIDALIGRFDYSWEAAHAPAGGEVYHWSFELIEPGAHRTREVHLPVCGIKPYVRILSVDACRIGGVSYADCGRAIELEKPSGKSGVTVVLAQSLLGD